LLWQLYRHGLYCTCWRHSCVLYSCIFFDQVVVTTNLFRSMHCFLADHTWWAALPSLSPMTRHPLCGGLDLNAGHTWWATLPYCFDHHRLHFNVRVHTPVVQLLGNWQVGVTNHHHDQKGNQSQKANQKLKTKVLTQSWDTPKITSTSSLF
jgi:hypothetical protein